MSEKNILLKNYIEVILNKENITKKDLEEVKEIVLNSEDILGEYNKVYIEEISLFPNLEEITIKNLGLKLEDMQLLRKVKKVSFRNCEVNAENDTIPRPQRPSATTSRMSHHNSIPTRSSFSSIANIFLSTSLSPTILLA